MTVTERFKSRFHRTLCYTGNETESSTVYRCEDRKWLRARADRVRAGRGLTVYETTALERYDLLMILVNPDRTK